MKKPDKFEQMVHQSVGDPNELEIFGINATTKLLRRLYAQIRREIRRYYQDAYECQVLTSPEALLRHLDRWRRGKG